MRQVLLIGHTKFVQVNSMLDGIEAEFAASTCFWDHGSTALNRLSLRECR
jgi:hypothetical protein